MQPPLNEPALTLSVLLVDNNPAVLRRHESLISGEGHKVWSTTSGHEGWKLIKEIKPDVVITDWRMPGISGLDLCRLIRRLKLDHYISVIFLTDKSSNSHVREAFRAGADDYFFKPVDKRELLTKLSCVARVAHHYRPTKERTTSVRFAERDCSVEDYLHSTSLDGCEWSRFQQPM